MKTKKIRKMSIKLTWFGHAAFLIESPGGKKVLVDPWLDNPRAPGGAKDLVSADLILVTHGHSDHVGNTLEIAKRTGAKVIAIHELAGYFQSERLPNVTGMNKGGTLESDGIRVTMVDAKHSSDFEVAGKAVSGGEPAGYIVEFENGYTVYHAGDTAVFGDMQLIRRLYGPRAVILPIGGLYTMGPREAALACEFLNPRHIIGMHYGTFPVLSGTPAELKKLLPKSMKKRLLELNIGEQTVLS
jgi:L-ascorbate metabolism protein UlaG (beta-lactamase superfamily)